MERLTTTLTAESAESAELGSGQRPPIFLDLSFAGGKRFAVVLMAVSLWGCDGGLFSPRECGGIDDVPCGIDRYCSYAVGGCATDGALGECSDMPTACTEIYQPVCGCDNLTYANACFAAADGVSVLAEGTCEDVFGETCGGIAGAGCGNGEFCKFEFGVCGSGDQTGICLSLPESCSEDFDLVCGCHGTTHLNECLANQAGVSVAHNGQCVVGG